jgi:hypothetical protein
MEGFLGRPSEEGVRMQRPAAFSDRVVWLEAVRRVVASRGPLRDPPVRQDGSIEWHLVAMRTLVEGLDDLASLLIGSPRRWVVIASEWRGEAPPTNRYWQLLAFEDRSAIVEVVSNRYLAGPNRLSGSAEARLREIGWNPPQAGASPNWWAAQAAPPASAASIASSATRAMRDVLGFADSTKLLVKLFEFTYQQPTAAGRTWPEGTG